MRDGSARWQRCGVKLQIAGLVAIAIAAFGAGAAWSIAQRDAGSATRSANAAALPVFRSTELTPEWTTPSQLASERSAFPDFILIDQSGRAVTRSDLAGHVVVANFFFTSCSTLCPRLRSAMTKVRDEFRDDRDVLFLSHSVTPEIDTAPVLAAYARANHIDGEQWRLLTGPRETIFDLAYGGYFVPRPKAGEGNVLHTELFVLLDSKQRVRGIYNGTLPIEMGWLTRDIRELLGKSA